MLMMIVYRAVTVAFIIIVEEMVNDLSGIESIETGNLQWSQLRRRLVDRDRLNKLEGPTKN